MKKILILSAILLCCLIATGAAMAVDVTLAWDDPNTPETNVVGYTLYYGTVNPPTMVIDSPITQVTVSDLTIGTTYYFAVCAYNADAHSAKSAVLEYTIQPPSQTIIVPLPPNLNINITVTYPQ